MSLSVRHEAVLYRVVEAYIATAEPVSSARVRRQPPALTLCTATIRSCLRELSSAGLLEQPHASGGRVPTALGLRTYLAGLRPRLRQADRRCLEQAARAADGDAAALIAELGEALAALSGLLAVVAVPSFLGLRLHQVALVPCGGRRVLALFLCPNGLVQQKMVTTDEDLDAAAVQQVQNLINAQLGGKRLQEVRRQVDGGQWTQAAEPRLGQRAQAIARQILPEPKISIIAKGAAALLTQPEFADLCQLRRLMRDVQDEGFLLELQARLLTQTGVQVVLSDGQHGGTLGQLSCVGQASRPLGDGARTSIGLWGPPRMNYSRLVPLVAHATGVLDRLWQQL